MVLEAINVQHPGFFPDSVFLAIAPRALTNSMMNEDRKAVRGPCVIKYLINEATLVFWLFSLST